MVIDKFKNTNYFLRWAKEGQEDIAATFLSIERSLDPGYCLLFDKEGKGCKIHSVKPQEAKESGCWISSLEDSSSRSGPSFWRRYDILKFVPGFWPDGPPTIKYLDRNDIKVK